MRADLVTDRRQVANGVAQQDRATSVKVGDGQEARRPVRKRHVALLVEHLEVDLVRRWVVTAAQLDTFPRGALQLGGAEATLDRQIVFVAPKRSKRRRISSRVPAGQGSPTTRTRRTCEKSAPSSSARMRSRRT